MLFVPDKQEGQQNWAWASGAEHKKEEAEEESFEERQANREAVGEKAEESGAPPPLCPVPGVFAWWALGAAGAVRGPVAGVRWCCFGRAGPVSRMGCAARPTPPSCPPTLASCQPTLPAALFARKAVHQAELLRQQRREEQEALKKKKQFTWNQKVRFIARS